jgi:hypothetical protein
VVPNGDISRDERQLPGVAFDDLNVACGSARDDHAGELTAEKLTSRLRGGIAAGHGRQGPATS